MTALHRPRAVAALLATALVTAFLIAGSAATGQSGTAATTITGSGVGAVTLGSTFSELYRAGRVGVLRKGCLLNPSARAARLKAPLKGFVDLTSRKPRRVATILISGGATARGVGVGSTTAGVRAAFPQATVDKRPRQVFAIDLIKVSRAAGGRFEFAVDSKTQKVLTIGVPFIAFCD